MKKLLVYSSKTGNTKAVAEAIASDLDEVTLCSVKDAPDLADYDCIICGYWVDKGMPDDAAKSFMEGIENKQIILFGTLGAYPDGEHAKEVIKKAQEIVEAKSNIILGSWICMGKVDPKLLEAMSSKYSEAHPMSEERRIRIEEGNKHPNAEDFANAKSFVKSCLEKTIL